MIPMSKTNFFARKILDFLVIAAIKQQWRLKSLTMVCSYRSSCIDLPVALVDCWVEGFPSRFHHVYQGGYVAMNEINLDGGERNICHDCVEEIRGRGKSETLKMVGYSTVYGTDESE